MSARPLLRPLIVPAPRPTFRPAPVELPCPENHDRNGYGEDNHCGHCLGEDIAYCYGKHFDYRLAVVVMSGRALCADCAVCRTCGTSLTGYTDTLGDHDAFCAACNPDEA